MSQTITPGPYNVYQSQAMVGMKADSMNDNVDTFAAAVPIPFGVVVGRVAAHDLKVQPGGTAPVGVALHDHVIGSRGGYIQYDAVSVLTRGRCWVRLKSKTNVADGVYAQYDPADGTFEAGAGTNLINAVFRSPAVDLPDTNEIVYGDGVLVPCAVVELHYPLANPAGGGTGTQDAGPTEDTKRYLDEQEKHKEEVQKRREEQRERMGLPPGASQQPVPPPDVSHRPVPPPGASHQPVPPGAEHKPAPQPKPAKE